MDQYAIYLRKSRKDDELEALGEGETLARHKKALTEYAAKHRLAVGKVYEEVVSGDTISARPVMQKLLADVGAGLWRGVLVMEIERLARGDTMDQGLVAQTFKFSNTLIITPVKTYDPNDEFDEEYFEFGLFMSRREYKTINRRLQRGRMTSVSEGKFLGSRAPYGYERYKLPGEKGYSLRPIEPQASVIKYIFDLYTVGEASPAGNVIRLGCAKIARRLNDDGVPSMTGVPWTPATVRDMLRNPVYAGKIRWGKRKQEKRIEDGRLEKVRTNNKNDGCVVVDGLHAAIVTESQFNAAQDLLDKNPPRPLGEKGVITNPLAGLIVCAVCGHHMQRRPYSRNYPATLICPTISCECVGARFDLVEKQILKILSGWVSQYEVELQAPAKTKNPKDDVVKPLLKSQRAERTRLESQKAKIYEAYETGVYDSSTFAERIREVEKKIEETSERIAELEKKESRADNRRERFGLLVPKIKKLLEDYDNLSPQEKNNLLSEVLEKAVYFRQTSGRWTGVLDDFEISLFPKLPQ